jgi:hypothetical protein
MPYVFAGCLAPKDLRDKDRKLKPPRTTKPDVDAAGAREEAAATGTTQADRAAAPGAAAKHAEATSHRTSGVAYRCIHFAVPVAVIPVPTPLPYVPRHIVQSVAVSHIYARRRLLSIVVSHRARPRCSLEKGSPLPR